MARSQETFNKKEVRNKKEKKRKEKAQKKLDKKEGKKSSLDDMIAYVDENGMIVDTPPEPKKSNIKAEDIEIAVPKAENIEVDPIRNGVVSFFNNDKGFGFIKDLETKESIFVHINNTEEPINEGNLVTFEMGSGPKGPTAINVKQKK